MENCNITDKELLETLSKEKATDFIMDDDSFVVYEPDVQESFLTVEELDGAIEGDRPAEPMPSTSSAVDYDLIEHCYGNDGVEDITIGATHAECSDSTQSSDEGSITSIDRVDYLGLYSQSGPDPEWEVPSTSFSLVRKQQPDKRKKGNVNKPPAKVAKKALSMTSKTAFKKQSSMDAHVASLGVDAKSGSAHGSQSQEPEILTSKGRVRQKLMKRIDRTRSDQAALGVDMDGLLTSRGLESNERMQFHWRWLTDSNQFQHVEVDPTTDSETYFSKRTVFDAEMQPGSRATQTSVIGLFKEIITIDLVNSIVENINMYAQQSLEIYQRIIPPSARSNVLLWTPTNADEIYTFFGVLILMGIIKKPSIKSYWSTTLVIETPFFSRVMSYDRFRLLLTFLHFSDNTKKDKFTGPQKLYKIHSVIEHLNNKFQELFVPPQNLSLDESLLLWKGPLGFRQYCPKKAAKTGMKLFEICDPRTAYCWSFKVYSCDAKDFGGTDAPSFPAKVVLHIAEPLFGKGYTLWMDNWYNSPYLARALKERDTDCVGTVLLNRKELPFELELAHLEPDAVIGVYSDVASVISWQDTKRVDMISTYHNLDRQVVTTRLGRGRTVSKPVCILDYNKYMRGVDKNDQLLEPYSMDRKRLRKWYVKLFLHLLSMSIYNSYVLYQEQGLPKKMTHLEWRLELVNQLFAAHGSIARPLTGRPSLSAKPLRLMSGRHFVNRIPPSEKKQKPYRRCIVCNLLKKRKETTYWCLECKVALCPDGCFVAYHTDVDLIPNP